MIAPDIYKNIVTGKVKIDYRLDLHGMTENSAYEYLQDFFEYAENSRFRTILIITGKGNGILQKIVPKWLSIQNYVRDYEISDKKHGGEGALYVRLNNIHK